MASINNGIKINNIKLYNDLNALFESTNVNYMNHGYYPSYAFIKKEDLAFKNQVSLYLSLFEKINPNNKDILEIGCGRGGGINSLTKYFKFKSIDACDINKTNINFCKNNYKNNVNYKVSNAEKLDYADSSFDIVISVESSHCYENFSLFFNEVKRVLRPNGIFLYTDCGKVIQSFPNFFSLFKNIIRKDITENVKKSCENDIINFNNLDIEQEVKEWLISLSVFKYNEYSLNNNQYITYSCSNSDEWFSKL